MPRKWSIHNWDVWQQKKLKIKKITVSSINEYQVIRQLHHLLCAVRILESKRTLRKIVARSHIIRSKNHSGLEKNNSRFQKWGI